MRHDEEEEGSHEGSLCEAVGQQAAHPGAAGTDQAKGDDEGANDIEPSPLARADERVHLATLCARLGLSTRSRPPSSACLPSPCTALDNSPRGVSLRLFLVQHRLLPALASLNRLAHHERIKDGHQAPLKGTPGLSEGPAPLHLGSPKRIKVRAPTPSLLSPLSSWPCVAVRGLFSAVKGSSSSGLGETTRLRRVTSSLERPLLGPASGRASPSLQTRARPAPVSTSPQSSATPATTRPRASPRCRCRER